MNKNAKIWDKESLFWYFWPEFEKTIAMFEISALKFVKHKLLTHPVSFGIEFVFSKALGSTFSEGPDPGPSQLYKLCRLNASLKFITKIWWSIILKWKFSFLTLKFNWSVSHIFLSRRYKNFFSTYFTIWIY